MKRLPKTGQGRKRRFKAALALAGQTMWQFAAANGMSSGGRLTRVLDGEIADDELLVRVDAYIERYLVPVERVERKQAVGE